MRAHVIKTDDTLQRLAAFYYGDWTLYTLIREANLDLIPDEFSLIAGNRIKIPTPTFEDAVHVISVNDTYQSISLLYFETEHFAERLRMANDNLTLSENIGADILIPALVDFDRFRKALEWLNS